MRIYTAEAKINTGEEGLQVAPKQLFERDKSSRIAQRLRQERLASASGLVVRQSDGEQV
jgi:hypothetical protein